MPGTLEPSPRMVEVESLERRGVKVLPHSRPGVDAMVVDGRDELTCLGFLPLPPGGLPMLE